MIYLIRTNPLISNIIKIIVSRLKYLSMNSFIFGPKKWISVATKKNLALLPIMDAAIRGNKPT